MVSGASVGLILMHLRPIFQLLWKVIYYDSICTLVIDEVSKAILARVRQKVIAIAKYIIYFFFQKCENNRSDLALDLYQ